MLKHAVVLSLFVVAGSAAAGDMQTPFYVKGGLGYAWSTDAGVQNRAETGSPQIAGTLNHTGNATVYDIAAGTQLAPSIRAEVSYQYRDGFKLSGTDVFPGASVAYNSKIKSQAVLLSGFYDLPAIASITPFVGVGIGMSRNEMKTLNYTGTFNGSGVGGTKDSLAWQLTAGASIAVQKNLLLDVAYRYTDLGKIQTKSGMNSDDTGVYRADGIGGKLRSNELTLSLRHSF